MCASPAQVILSVLPVLRLLVQHDIFTLLALFSLRHHTQKLRLVFLSISEQTTSQKHFRAMTKAIPTCFKPVLAITISNRQSEKRLTSTKYFAKKDDCLDVLDYHRTEYTTSKKFQLQEPLMIDNFSTYLTQFQNAGLISNLLILMAILTNKSTIQKEKKSNKQNGLKAEWVQYQKNKQTLIFIGQSVKQLLELSLLPKKRIDFA